MAKSIDYYYGLIIAEKNSQLAIKDQLKPDSTVTENMAALMAQLTSTSKVAIWRLWVWIVAAHSWVIDSLLDKHKADVQYIADTAQYGGDAWWYDRALEFQLDDTVQVLTDASGKKYSGYSTVKPDTDPSRIIKLCAVVSKDGVTIIKVATLTGGAPSPIGSSLSAFNTYIKTIQPSGVKVKGYSVAADLVKYTIDLEYDSLLPLADVKAAVESAIVDYHSNLVYNGVLYLSKLGDAIQQTKITVDGGLSTERKVLCIKDFKINTAEGKSSTATTYATINRTYATDSGYVIIDPAFPLSTTINYIAG
jgi:hypothetical protein